jgi:uncharacterized protein
MQVEQRQTGKMIYELIQPAVAGRGLGALPPPTSDDLFFDMEGDPFAGDGGLEYLFGVVELVDGEPRYHPFWGHNQSEEKQAFEAFIDFIMMRLEKNPNLHIYHMPVTGQRRFNVMRFTLPGRKKLTDCCGRNLCGYTGSAAGSAFQ